MCATVKKKKYKKNKKFHDPCMIQ